MAYYPAQDILIVAAKTKEEMESDVTAAMNQGYFPVDDNSVWNAKLVEPTMAYRQAMVKYENTDAQYIANMYAAFKTILESIDSKLSAIVTNTNRIS